ncbi:hypothetical protein P9112_000955 [Eukaryota sp. TZLM1-RC]
MFENLARALNLLQFNFKALDTPFTKANVVNPDRKWSNHIFHFLFLKANLATFPYCWPILDRDHQRTFDKIVTTTLKSLEQKSVLSLGCSRITALSSSRVLSVLCELSVYVVHSLLRQSPVKNLPFPRVYANLPSCQRKLINHVTRKHTSSHISAIQNTLSSMNHCYKQSIEPIAEEMVDAWRSLLRREIELKRKLNVGSGDLKEEEVEHVLKFKELAVLLGTIEFPANFTTVENSSQQVIDVSSFVSHVPLNFANWLNELEIQLKSLPSQIKLGSDSDLGNVVSFREDLSNNLSLLSDKLKGISKAHDTCNNRIEKLQRIIDGICDSDVLNQSLLVLPPKTPNQSNLIDLFSPSTPSYHNLLPSKTPVLTRTLTRLGTLTRQRQPVQDRKVSFQPTSPLELSPSPDTCQDSQDDDWGSVNSGQEESKGLLSDPEDDLFSTSLAELSLKTPVAFANRFNSINK